MALIINGQDFTKRVIASIWPIALRADRPLYGGLFKIPAVPMGADPELLFVEHHQEILEVPVTHKKVSQTITSAEIAHCIWNQWSGNGLFMDTESGPGVWILKLPGDRLPDVDNPGEVAMAVQYGLPEAKARQRLYADRKVKHADEMYRDTKTSKAIDDTTKLLCKYYGYERDWLNDLKDHDVAVCPICKKVNEGGALKCQNCHATLDAYALARQEAQMAEEWKAAGKRVREEARKRELEKANAQPQEPTAEPEPDQESVTA